MPAGAKPMTKEEQKAFLDKMYELYQVKVHQLADAKASTSIFLVRRSDRIDHKPYNDDDRKTVVQIARGVATKAGQIPNFSLGVYCKRIMYEGDEESNMIIVGIIGHPGLIPPDLTDEEFKVIMDKYAEFIETGEGALDFRMD